MKKPVFIVTEVLLSLLLAASAGTAAVLAADIRTGGAVIPPSVMDSIKKATGTDSKKPQSSQAPQESSSAASETASEEAKESEEPSKAASEPQSQEESSAAESSAEESRAPENTLDLQLEEPKNLNAQPEELTKLIKDYGYDYTMLGFDKFIVVHSDDKSGAEVYCYQRSSKGYWWDIAGTGKPITDKAFVGEKGVDFDIKPDSKKTPMGFYSIDEGFYIGEKPTTTFPMFEIKDDTYWVNDPDSRYYNSKVDGTDNKDWSTAEHMIDAKDAYKYGIVVEFNTDTPPDKKLASSIFMHIGSAPTQGSICVPEDVLKAIIEWLDDDSRTYIFIT